MKPMVLLRAVVLMFAFNAVVSAQQSQQTALHTIDLSTIGMAAQSSFIQGTVAFLSEHTIAVSACAGTDCSLATFEFADGNIRQIGKRAELPRYGRLFATHDSGIVLAHVIQNGKVGDLLLDPELRDVKWTARTQDVFSQGDKIPEGKGRLLGHAANRAAYLSDGAIQINNLSGQVLGTFNAEAVGGESIQSVNFLGGDRLSLQKAGRFVIVDYHGKIIQRLKPPSLSYKADFSMDGNLIVFDSFTRHVGSAQAIKDKALIVLTMGMSADGDAPNEEIVRIVDTRSGKQCFEWKGNANLLQPFESHADIDPSGQLIAILTQGSVAIYRLPPPR